MWSSPLLLLVLVFTLTSHPLRPRAHATSTTASSTVTTTDATSTTARSRATTTTSSPAPATTTSVVSSATSTSSIVTTTTVAGRPLRHGSLTLADPNVLVALSGPLAAVLHASHQVTATLQCGSRVAAVTGVIRLSTRQQCQLDITVTTGALTWWTLSSAR